MAKKARKKAKKTSKKAGKKKAGKKKAGKKKGKRTTMRSSAGKKLYAVRAADGSFQDIQQYSRAQAMDIKRDAKSEN